MDEIDNIIIHSLRQIGCDIDDETHSLSSFTPEMLVASVSKCLMLIKPTLEVPTSLPPGMAQRFSVTTNLAEACKGVGFRGDIGYQTFLYTNVTEVRRVFMFLIERLPKEAEKVTPSQALDYPSAVKQELVRSIFQSLNSTWLPPPCRVLLSERNSFCPKHINIPDLSPDTERTSEKPPGGYFTSLFNQTSPEAVLPSVIAKNDEDLLGNFSPFTLERQRSSDKTTLASETASKEEIENASSQEQQQDDPHLQNTQKVRTPLEILQEEIEEMKLKIENAVSNRQGIVEEIDTSKESISRQEERMKSLKMEKRIRERTNIVLENPEENVAKLEAMVENSREKMKKLELQWQEHEAPLLESLSSAQKKNSKEMSKTKHLVDQIASVRVKSEEISQEFKQKSATHAQLTTELTKLSQQQKISRNAYTSRILEIIGNIRKQKNDIDKVLRDTRELQKTINTVTGQLDRQFTVTDDLIYRTAKRDENSRKAYKLLATLHADCSELINYVQETGAITREIRDLEDQIETEKMRNVSANLERITTDLHQMQKESQVLEEKLRAALQQRQNQHQQE